MVDGAERVPFSLSRGAVPDTPFEPAQRERETICAFAAGVVDCGMWTDDWTATAALLQILASPLHQVHLLSPTNISLAGHTKTLRSFAG